MWCGVCGVCGVCVRWYLQGEDVAYIEKSLKTLLAEAEEKSLVAQNIAEQVIEEKQRVEAERASAAAESRACEEIKVRLRLRLCLLCVAGRMHGW